MKKILIISLSVFVITLFSDFVFTPGSLQNNLSTARNHTSKIIKKGKNNFKAMLSGKNVVPPVKTKAYGEATFDFSKDGKKVYYKVTVHKIDSVIMAHIHHAPEGKDGPIAVWLYKGKPTGKVNGVLSKGVITEKDVNLDSLRTWIQNGDAYVLVHTKKYPNGEIRGTIK